MIVEPRYIGNQSHKFIHYNPNGVDFIAKLILFVATSRLLKVNEVSRREWNASRENADTSQEVQRHNLSALFLAYLEFLCAHYCLLQASLWIISPPYSWKDNFFSRPSPLTPPPQLPHPHLQTLKRWDTIRWQSFPSAALCFPFVCVISVSPRLPLSVSIPDPLGCTFPPPSV